ncbi:ATP-binding cassette domain-containing protein [Ruminococcus sp. AF18-22]|nr:ATP-binding cassette domain-containing protein [Ruminococcus sp. AF18-22]
MSLNAEHITFSYKENQTTRKTIIRDISLEIREGERIGIQAPSGTGKTTLMKILSGYLKPDSGQIFIDGEPIGKQKYCPVQMIWQHPEMCVNPRLKMKSVLAEGDRIERQVIEKLGIEDTWLERFPQELSGGELQRFCIARALGQRTKYLVADEISTMMDAVTQCQIWEFLLNECSKRKIGILAASHSRELLDRVCTKVIKLETVENKYSSIWKNKEKRGLRHENRKSRKYVRRRGACDH